MATFWGKDWEMWKPVCYYCPTSPPKKIEEKILWSGTNWWGLFKFAFSSLIWSLIHFWSQVDPLWGVFFFWCQTFIYTHINSLFRGRMQDCEDVCVEVDHFPNGTRRTSRSRKRGLHSPLYRVWLENKGSGKRCVVLHAAFWWCQLPVRPVFGLWDRGMQPEWWGWRK